MTDALTPDEINELIVIFNSGQYLLLENRALAHLQQQPASGFAWKVLGVALQRQGKDALPALLKASELLPEDAETWSNLGNALQNLDRNEEAITCFQRALTYNPHFVEVHCNLGNALREQGHLASAIASLRQAVALKPDYAIAHYNLANALRDNHQLPEAITSYRHAVMHNPALAEAQNNIGICQQDLGQLDDALVSFHQAIVIRPNYADAYYNLGKVLYALQRIDQALICYRMAASLDTHHADAYNNMGNILKDQGQLNEASHAYDAATSIRPDFIDAHYSRSQLKTYHAADTQPRMLEQLSEHIPSLSPELQIKYWFTIGKMREDLQQYDAAFQAYQAGNLLQHTRLHWNDEAESLIFKNTLNRFSKEFFATTPRAKAGKRTPIFIVGMPRSGTSLLEQILSSYPGIFGAGELPYVSEVVTMAMPETDFSHYPAAITTLQANDFEQMGKQYQECLWHHAPDAAHVIDKMPSNFYYLGIIHLMLPHAKIIHAMRDPMDSCFSCYARLFSDANLPFSYDLENLGRYFQRYHQLMQHWHTVLPAGSIFDLHYEDLIANTEGETRRLLNYLELPWNEACLDFHNNQRAVKTASLAQVRKPVYHSSVARWKRFANHLTPLFELVKNCR